MGSSVCAVIVFTSLWTMRKKDEIFTSPGKKRHKDETRGETDQCLQRGFLNEGVLRQGRVKGKERGYVS